METDRFVFMLDAPTGEHPQSEYLRLRGYRHGHRRSLMWPGEEKAASRIEVALLEALEREEEQGSQSTIVAVRQEMGRLVQAFMKFSYAHQLVSLQHEVGQLRHELDEFRHLVVSRPPIEVEPRPVVNWERLEEVLPAVGHEMNWNVEWHVDRDSSVVVGRVAGAEPVTLVQQKFDFYERLASNLDKETFKALTFELEPAE